MRIEINNPVYLLLKVIEMEDTLPSWNFEVLIKKERIFDSVIHKNTVWITQEDLKIFLDRLEKDDVAELHDMSNDFSIELFKKDNKHQFNIRSKAQDNSGECFELTYTTKINFEITHQVKENFLSIKEIF